MFLNLKIQKFQEEQHLNIFLVSKIHITSIKINTATTTTTTTSSSSTSINTTNTITTTTTPSHLFQQRCQSRIATKVQYEVLGVDSTHPLVQIPAGLHLKLSSVINF